MKIQRLSLALSSANNLRIRSGQADNRELFDYVAGEAAALEGHLLKFIAECQAVNKNGDLTPAGKQTRIGQLQIEMAEALSKANKSDELQGTVDRMAADLSGRAKAAREKNRSGDDKTLNLMREIELRRYLSETRATAKIEHKERLEGAAALSDRDRKFNDPVAKLFIEAAATYDADKEFLIGAIQNAPYPMQLIPQDVIQQGMATIERVINPELAAAVDINKVKAAMYATVLEGVSGIVAEPLSQAILAERQVSTPDGAAVN